MASTASAILVWGIRQNLVRSMVPMCPLKASRTTKRRRVTLAGRVGQGEVGAVVGAASGERFFAKDVAWSLPLLSYHPAATVASACCWLSGVGDQPMPVSATWMA